MLAKTVLCILSALPSAVVQHLQPTSSPDVDLFTTPLCHIGGHLHFTVALEIINTLMVSGHGSMILLDEPHLCASLKEKVFAHHHIGS